MYYSSSERVQPQLGENAMRVLRKRYLRGETPEQMFWRVASHVASAQSSAIKAESSCEQEANRLEQQVATRYYNLMASLDFLPNSPALMNAGRPLGQLSACFVLPVEDSMESIFDAIKNMALVQKCGGGTGFSFDKLRPSGDPVSSTVGEASGPVSFMRAFNACTEVVKQGGARRGANMGILRIDHPDIMEFIDAKSDLTQLTNFNMSVAITNEFMQCLIEEKLFTLKFKGVEYAKVDPMSLWNKIVKRAWATGEPGVIFIDTINEDNPTPKLGTIESTNPCGEQPLLPYESCNLGSINLANFAVTPLCDNPKDNINWEKLHEAVWLATQFLDDVIDVNHYPLEKIDEQTRATRKIGLGVMGWADLLYQLRIPYSSTEALSLAESVMSFIQNESHKCSQNMALYKGCFPEWVNSIWHKNNIPMRNAATTTIAPTGTLSVIAGVSSGIEPLFGLYFEKTLVEGVTEGGTLTVLNQHLLDYLSSYDEDTINNVITHLKQYGTLRDMDNMEQLASIFQIASDISPADHIHMQAAFQKYTDNAVSKTINFDNDVTPEEVGRTLLLAYELGCKGVTVYRDGSRSSQPLTKGTKHEDSRNIDTIPNEIDKTLPTTNLGSRKIKRPEEVPGVTKKIRTGCGSMFVTTNEYNGEIYEVFLRAGDTGGCAAFTDATGRLISIALRYGVPIREIIRQLNSVRCDNFRHQTGKDPTLQGKSCPDAVGRVMATMLEKIGKKQNDTTSVCVESEIPEQASLSQSTAPLTTNAPVVGAFECPECHELTLHNAEGCIVCVQCGYSRC